MHEFTHKITFFVYKICTYQIKVVILHRQTKNNNSKTFRTMKIYSVKKSDGTTKDVYSLQSVKRIFKEDLGATAFGWKIYSNGDTVALGEVSRKGSNAVRLSNQTTYNYQ